MTFNMRCRLLSTVGALSRTFSQQLYVQALKHREILDHHQGFNSSLGTFHSIMRSITTSQAKVRALRESLVQAKTDLSTSKPEVKNMVETSQKYDTMLRTLASMFVLPY
jgi:hypothetical protein